MRALFISGFLGSGKTTIINRLTKEIAAGPDTVAVIENEIGEIGIDQNLIRAGLRVRAISGGCICCELFGNLLAALEQIRQEYSPDWAVVETTGLAMLSQLRNTYRAYGPGDVPFYSITVVDTSRFEYLWDAVEPLLRSQLEQTDLVLLNKTDLVPPSGKLMHLVSEVSGHTAVWDSRAIPDGFLWRKISTTIREVEHHA